jgi:hypothetical protein
VSTSHSVNTVWMLRTRTYRFIDDTASSPPRSGDESRRGRPVRAVRSVAVAGS